MRKRKKTATTNQLKPCDKHTTEEGAVVNASAHAAFKTAERKSVSALQNKTEEDLGKGTFPTHETRLPEQ